LRQLPIQLKGLAKPGSGMPLQHGDHAHVIETVSAPRLHRGQQQSGRNPPPGDHGDGVDGRTAPTIESGLGAPGLYKDCAITGVTLLRVTRLMTRVAIIIIIMQQDEKEGRMNNEK